MSLSLSNLISHTHQEHRRALESQLCGGLPLYSPEASAIRYKIYLAFEEEPLAFEEEPLGSESWHCNEWTALWLFKVCPGFFFPKEGLAGEEHQRLLQNLKVLQNLMDRGQVRPHPDSAEDVMVQGLKEAFGCDFLDGTRTEIQRVSELIEFLSRNSVVFS